MRPRCAQCERLGFECIYEVPDTSANLLVPREYVLHPKIETHMIMTDESAQ